MSGQTNDADAPERIPTNGTDGPRAGADPYQRQARCGRAALLRGHRIPYNTTRPTNDTDDDERLRISLSATAKVILGVLSQIDWSVIVAGRKKSYGECRIVQVCRRVSRWRYS
ncbi:MAG TPA: hypothetical protein VL486_11185 [Verrucomicrobiae bacterium]|nr:hypothetical protein [Verrucomicrobiae bacterium]